MKTVFIFAIFTSLLSLNIHAVEIDSTCDKTLDFESRLNPKEGMEEGNTKKPAPATTTVRQ